MRNLAYRTSSIVLAAGVVIFTTSRPAVAQINANGGFETGTFSGWTAGADWAVECAGTAHSGNCAARGTNGSITTGNFAARRTDYTVELWVRNPGASLTISRDTGEVVATIGAGTYGTYQKVSYTFSNGWPSQALVLTASGSGVGVEVDDISVKAEQSLAWVSGYFYSSGQVGESLVVKAQATSGSDPVYTSSTPAVCTVSLDSLRLIASGTCTVMADQAGNSYWNPTPQITQSFPVSRRSQAITFASLTDRALSSQTFTVIARASSNLAVSFTSATVSVCTVAGSTVTLAAVGICTIAANQAGNATYSAAPEVSRTFTIAKASSTTTVSCPTSVTYTGAPQAVCTALVTGFGGLSDEPVVVYTDNIDAGAATASASFAGDANHDPSSASTTFTIAKGGSIAGVTCPASVTYDGTAKTVCSASVTGAGGLNQSLIVTYTDNLNAGTAHASASYAGDGNHDPSSATATFTIARANQTITFDPLQNRTFGDPDFAASATASSGLQVAFSASGHCNVANGIVHLTGVGACTVVASQAGNTNYSAAPEVSRSFTVNGASDARMALDAPVDGAVLTSLQPFQIIGWALDLGAGFGTGVDVIHLWVYPRIDGGFGDGVFVGAIGETETRDDVGAFFGNRFSASGWAFTATGLAAGRYRLIAFAHSTLAGSFNNSQFADITVNAPTPNPAMALDVPRNDAVMGTSMTVHGWAIDAGAPIGTGVDAVHIYAYPIINGALGVPVFLGEAATGNARPDVGAVFGARFTSSGFSLDVPWLQTGRYRLVAYAHSTVNGANQFAFADVTCGSDPRPYPWMAVDGPAADSIHSQPFLVSGWAADLGAPSGTGVDAVHLWAFRVSDAAATFVGVPSYGGARSDVAAVFGSRFTNVGYSLTVTGLPPGTYDLGIYVRSTVSGTFNQVRFVRVTVR